MKGGIDPIELSREIEERVGDISLLISEAITEDELAELEKQNEGVPDFNVYTFRDKAIDQNCSLLKTKMTKALKEKTAKLLDEIPSEELSKRFTVANNQDKLPQNPGWKRWR